MRYIVQFLALIEVSILILSCNTKNRMDVDAYKVVVIKTDSVHLDSLTGPENNSIVFLNYKNNVYMYLFNTHTNTLFTYDWGKEHRLIGEKKFSKEGPNGVGLVNYVYANNPDSIYLLSNYDYRLSLINREGNLIKRYKLINFDPQDKDQNQGIPQGGYSILIQADYNSPIFQIENKLFLTGLPNLNPYVEGFYEKSKISMRLDLNNNFISYFMEYPQIYKLNKSYPLASLQANWTYNSRKKQFIYSFPDDNNLYAVNLLGKVVESVEIKSVSFVKPVPMPKLKTHNPEKSFTHYMSNPHFERIIYDPYKNLYYRFVKVNRYENFEKGMKYPFEYKIIIIDENLNKIAEVNSNIAYDHGYFFISKDGLYLQENKTDNEDYLYFSLITFEKI